MLEKVSSRPTSRNFEENIKKYATILNDDSSLTKLSDADFVSKEVSDIIIHLAGNHTKEKPKLFRIKILTNPLLKIWHSLL